MLQSSCQAMKAMKAMKAMQDTAFADSRFVLSSFVQMTARISYVALGPQKADIVVLHEH